MRGRQVFMESLVQHGVRYMFGNPGTTESPILDARVDYPQLESDAQRVLKELVPIEREVSDARQRWYLARMLPYRTSEALHCLPLQAIPRYIVRHRTK